MSENLQDRIGAWIREKVTEAGAAGIAVGLSGGIDSALVSVLAKMVLGKNVLGAIMPCNSNPLDAEHARLVAEKFNIETITLDLAQICREYLAVLPEGTDLARANLKPRLRMIALYFVANTRNYLVAGTGNKSERMIGYFTKHGDGGVDLMPIGNLCKCQVRQLAREVGVPPEIVEKPPSAGLWANQTDEGEIGMTYDELDGVLRALETGGDLGDFAAEKVAQVKRMMAASEHKRTAAGIFVP